jgi:LemA protein
MENTWIASSNAFLISVIIFLAFVISIWLIKLHNAFIPSFEATKKFQANLEAEIKRKLDLIYQLAESIKDGSDYERSVFKQLAEIRSSTVNNSIEEEKKVNKVIAFSESTPSVNSINLFQSYQNQISDTETRIQKAKAQFNNSAAEYNALIKLFPNNIGAMFLKFNTINYVSN